MGRVGGERVAALGESEHAQELFDACPRLRLAKPVDLSGEKKVLFDREVVEQPEAFRQHADAALHFERLRRHIQPTHRGLAGSGGQKPAEHLDGGRFAGAVGTEKGADRTSCDFQRQAVHGRHGAESLGELAAGYHSER